jgi:hypothetical protein
VDAATLIHLATPLSVLVGFADVTNSVRSDEGDVEFYRCVHQTRREAGRTR